MDPKETGNSFDCAKMMEKMMTMCRGVEKKDEKAPRE
jgi:hypothetical protein